MTRQTRAGAGAHQPMVALEHEGLDGNAELHRQLVRLAEIVHMADDDALGWKGWRTPGKGKAGQRREIAMGVEMQLLVPPMPGFGQPALLFQDRHRHVGLDQGLRDSQSGGAGANDNRRLDRRHLLHLRSGCRICHSLSKSIQPPALQARRTL